jgi:hypothetical protein
VLVFLIVVLRVWERGVLTRARGWPVAQGPIDSVSIQKYSSKQRTRWVTRLNYSFAAFGKRYTGRYSRTFAYQDEAEDYQRRLQERSIPVHHSSRWPALSLVLDDDVDRLLQSYPAQPSTPPFDAWQPVKTSWWKKVVGYPLMIYAAAGFSLSLYVHIASWFGRVVLPQSSFFLLHVGIFVAFFPALLLTPKSGKRRRDDQDRMPVPLARLMKVSLIYAVANFAVFMISVARHDRELAPAVQWRGFSGHWMAFYLWSFAFLYAALHPRQSQAETRAGRN